MGKTETSVYLSYLLRHHPEAVNLDMDEHGWVSVSQLIDHVNAAGKYALSPDFLRDIVQTDDKGRYRFSPDGARIKACQGHSIPWVIPEMEWREPPQYLYHGTPPTHGKRFSPAAASAACSAMPCTCSPTRKRRGSPQSAGTASPSF